MLNSFDLLKAMNGIDPEDVAVVGKLLGYYRLNTKVHSTRKLWRTVLIAAVITSLLCCTAYGIYLSFHAKQQEQIKQEYQVVENKVAAYEEFPVPEATKSPTPTITLLSTYNEGRIQRVFVNVSPVSPDEVRDVFMQDTDAEGRVHYLEWASSIDGGKDLSMAEFYLTDRRYEPEDYITVTDPSGYTYEAVKDEAKKEKYLSQAYDSETQTLTLQCRFWLDQLPENANHAEFSIYLNHVSAFPDDKGGLAIDHKREILKNFGTINVNIVPADTISHMLPEPLEFTNPEDKRSFRILGFELSSGQITWIIDLDDEVWPYFNAMESFGEKGSEEWKKAYLHLINWINYLDVPLSDAKLVLDRKSVV